MQPIVLCGETVTQANARGAIKGASGNHCHSKLPLRPSTSLLALVSEKQASVVLKQHVYKPVQNLKELLQIKPYFVKPREDDQVCQQDPAQKSKCVRPMF